MRPVCVFSLAAALGAIALLPACAGNSPGSSSLVPSSTAFLAASRPGERGRPLTGCSGERRAQQEMAHSQPVKAEKGVAELYVLDICEPSIDVFNAKTYRELGSIASGLDQPDDLFVDRKGNLYVSNETLDGDVTEYTSGEPIFTYSANMGRPYVVTTDAKGDVYEGDTYNGYINEYSQHQNNGTVASCQPVADGNDAVVGLAVDSHNDVFAEINDTDTFSYELVEYPGGLTGCPSPAVLPLPTADMAGYPMAIDKNGNLLIPVLGSVEVVDGPSYSTVNATIGSGFQCAANVTLNRANTLAYVTDECNDTVTVVNYPSGTNVTVLGSGNGLTDPQAAVASLNAVY